MRNIQVDARPYPPAGRRDGEIVERNGLGQASRQSAGRSRNATRSAISSNVNGASKPMGMTDTRFVPRPIWTLNVFRLMASGALGPRKNSPSLFLWQHAHQQLRTGVHAEHAIDRANVIVHSMLAEAKFLGNVLFEDPADEQIEYAALGGG